IDMSRINVEVVSLSFTEDRARVTVAFNLKSGEGGMQMAYNLKRKGNRWEVDGPGSMVGASGGASQAEVPPNHPRVELDPNNGQLPAGHPPVPPNPAGSKE